MTDRELQLKSVHLRKRTLKAIFRGAKTLTLMLCVCLPAGGRAGDWMVFEGPDGGVTTNEYRSFIAHLDRQLPPTPSNNIGNVMVYERVGGGTLYGMQTVYAFSKDRRVFDKTVV